MTLATSLRQTETNGGHQGDLSECLMGLVSQGFIANVLTLLRRAMILSLFSFAVPAGLMN